MIEKEMEKCMEYREINLKNIEDLRKIAGESNVITEKDKMLDYAHDEYALEDIMHFPDVVVKPEDTKSVSEVMRYCYKENIAVTPRGAATGLCGGSVPILGGVVLSTENINKTIDIDEKNLIATVDAGVMLMDFYSALKEKNLFFPPHPGDESATIGGVIATNAGGARAVKYGVIRDFVKGVEVVLSDGEIIEVGGKFIKSSSGYSLLHLIIGSEGTLGIVTKAIISLMSPPKSMVTLVIPYDDIHDAINTVPVLIKNQILPMAIEFIEREPLSISEELLNKRWPYNGGKAHLMIIVDGNSEEEVMTIAENIGELALENKALDIFVADSESKQTSILEIRSNIYEAMKKYIIEILDITVPRASIGDYVDEVRVLEKKYDMWLPTYGHAGDGNVHTHLMKAKWGDGNWSEIEGWKDKYKEVRDELHKIGKKYKGIVSGEHGIGVVKRGYLDLFLSEKSIELMKGIKRVFDPKLILNPGKIFKEV